MTIVLLIRLASLTGTGNQWVTVVVQMICRNCCPGSGDGPRSVFTAIETFA